MNATRRKQIAAIKDKMIGLQSEIETIRDEEQEAFDNSPESIQQGERGQQSESAIAALDEAIEAIHSLNDQLDEAAT